LTYACFRNYIGGWENPSSFRVHRLWADYSENKVVIRSQIMQTLYFENALEHWKRISNYREYYVPKLNLVKLDWDLLCPDKQHKMSQFYSESLMANNFELRLVSSTFGLEIMGICNPFKKVKYVAGSDRP